MTKRISAQAGATGISADVPRAQDYVGPEHAADDEAEIISRADRADGKGAELFHACAQRQERHLQARARKQERDTEQQRENGAEIFIEHGSRKPACGHKVPLARGCGENGALPL